LHPDERRLFWYGHHVNASCRSRGGDPAGPDDLRAGYLRELGTTLPAVPDWQMAQVRQALEAFAQGVDHWRWEPTAHGSLEPRFRLKTAAQERPTDATASTGPDASGVEESRRPLRAGEDWRRRMRDVLRVRHYAWRTEQTYLEWVGRFVEWRGGGDPVEADTADVRRFLEHLAVERRISASTQNQAFSALLFFFERSWSGCWGSAGRCAPSGNPTPTVEPGRARTVAARLNGTFHLMASLMYGLDGLDAVVCGTRTWISNGGRSLSERKSDKDRVVMLPARLEGPLREHLARVRSVFDVIGVRLWGLAARRAGGEIPPGWDQWPWQWVFPAQPERRPARSRWRRHHVHESAVQKAIRRPASPASEASPLSLPSPPSRITCRGRHGHSDGAGATGARAVTR
jgi:hypothetical protein